MSTSLNEPIPSRGTVISRWCWITPILAAMCLILSAVVAVWNTNPILSAALLAGGGVLVLAAVVVHCIALAMGRMWHGGLGLATMPLQFVLLIAVFGVNAFFAFEAVRLAKREEKLADSSRFIANNWNKKAKQQGPPLPLIEMPPVMHGRALEQFHEIPLQAEPHQLEYAKSSGLVFVRQIGDTNFVLDAKTGDVVSSIDLKRSPFRFSLAGDESVLYASDFKAMHRFDLKSREWETATFIESTRRIEAVDAEHFLMLEGSGWNDVSLNHWPAGEQEYKELAKARAGHYGGIIYEPRGQRLFYASTKMSSESVVMFDVYANLIAMRGSANCGRKYSDDAALVVSVDGEHVFCDKHQMDADRLNPPLRAYHGPIFAASADLAFGGGGVYYDAATGEEIGRLPFSSEMVDVSNDGSELVAYDGRKGRLVFFRIVEGN